MLPVAEIFGPTLQGEGYMAGKRTLFVRLAYCDGAGGSAGWCTWCDSLHAVDPKNKSNWEMLSEMDIKWKLINLNRACHEVTISGGNPAIHNLDTLITVLHDSQFRINIETQGTIFQDWLARLDTITVSPKPPSSGADMKENLTRFYEWISQLEVRVLSLDSDPNVCVKVPVDVEGQQFNADYSFAREVFRMSRTVRGLFIAPYLSIVTYPTDTTESLLRKWRKLSDILCNDVEMPDVSLLAQLHVLLWGHKVGV